MLLVAAAACGSDDHSDTLSKDEYIVQGDALCNRFLRETAAPDEPVSPEEFVGFLDAAIEAAEDIYAEFSQLAPPPDGEQVHRSLLSALSESTEKVREAREAAADGDFARFESAMSAAVEIGRRSDAEAKAYGFTVCGSEDEIEVS